ncbi:hypothetical protein HX045_16025 [Myroides odoratimimus]|uniref:hypothetical protein n=1 Tax=Myroides odoratimimus TaxID=76832 RepID=UPI0025777350|nr:hypothetical protein [Myroides odoratimimus]MDM1094877.1 hypothetical protein [Myroides odoratimimus]MDM1412394.1 hypothetical protein [Myroides odoratimimus]MDM1451543.1 hypothetical protein [Myroides odoratimimus]MDM1454837.1 hypothetical protein [Myroides odoratimimus]MDM1465356.1 hypothetical protein [Myroides odoratimimus]
MEKRFLLCFFTLSFIFACSEDDSLVSKANSLGNVKQAVSQNLAFSEDMVLVGRTFDNIEAYFQEEMQVSSKGYLSLVNDCVASSNPNCLPDIVITAPSKPGNEITVKDLIEYYKSKNYDHSKELIDNKAILMFTSEKEMRYHVLTIK